VNNESINPILIKKELHNKNENQKINKQKIKLQDEKNMEEERENEFITNDLSKLPAFKQPKIKNDNDGVSFMEQMRKLDEIKQDKIANLMEKKINQNTISEDEMMELRRDLHPVNLSKMKPIGGDNDIVSLNPLDKQKNKIEEIRNLIHMNKKKKEDEKDIKSDDKIKEEELERRRNHFNQIKSQLKTNLINFSNNNDNE